MFAGGEPLLWEIPPVSLLAERNKSFSHSLAWLCLSAQHLPKDESSFHITKWITCRDIINPQRIFFLKIGPLVYDTMWISPNPALSLQHVWIKRGAFFTSVNIHVSITVLSLHKTKKLKVMIKLSHVSCCPGKADSCQRGREIKLEDPNSPRKGSSSF